MIKDNKFTETSLEELYKLKSELAEKENHLQTLNIWYNNERDDKSRKGILKDIKSVELKIKEIKNKMTDIKIKARLKDSMDMLKLMGWTTDADPFGVVYREGDFKIKYNQKEDSYELYFNSIYYNTYHTLAQAKQEIEKYKERKKLRGKDSCGEKVYTKGESTDGCKDDDATEMGSFEELGQNHETEAMEPEEHPVLAQDGYNFEDPKVIEEAIKEVKASGHPNPQYLAALERALELAKKERQTKDAYNRSDWENEERHKWTVSQLENDLKTAKERVSMYRNNITQYRSMLNSGKYGKGVLNDLKLAEKRYEESIMKVKQLISMLQRAKGQKDSMISEVLNPLKESWSKIKELSTEDASNPDWNVGNFDWDVGYFNGQWYITKNGRKFKGPFSSMEKAARYLDGHKWEFEYKLGKSKTGDVNTKDSARLIESMRILQLSGLTTDADEQWITMNGAHIKVEEGESKASASKKFIKEKGENPASKKSGETKENSSLDIDEGDLKEIRSLSEEEIEDKYGSEFRAYKEKITSRLKKSGQYPDMREYDKISDKMFDLRKEGKKDTDEYKELERKKKEWNKSFNKIEKSVEAKAYELCSKKEKERLDEIHAYFKKNPAPKWAN